MRVDSDSGRLEAAPTASPSKYPLRPIPTSLANDRVDAAQTPDSNESNDVSALRNWAQNEWSTLAGAVHGLASVPGVVSNAWRDAAGTNERLAKTIDSTLDDWPHRTASQRQQAIDDLRKTAAPISTTASKVAQDLAQANRTPLAVERALDTAIGLFPSGARAGLTAVARSVTSRMNALPVPAEARARAGAHALEAAASAQTAEASTTIGAVSEFIGRTVGKAHGLLTGDSQRSTFLDRLPVLRDTPVAGVLLTGASIVSDMRGGKSFADAAIANAGGMIVGTAVGSAVSTGLAAMVDSAAISDATALSLGAAAAAGPVGWTVAAGVVAAAAASYGVYKAVESKAGQELIDGVTQVSAAKIERGLQAARSDLIDGPRRAGKSFAAQSAVLP